MNNYKKVKRINGINVKTVHKRYAALLRIKSDSLVNKLLSGSEYSKIFNCTCFSNSDMEEIIKKDYITIEDACEHIIKTNEAAKIAGEARQAQKRARLEEYNKKVAELKALQAELGIEPSFI